MISDSILVGIQGWRRPHHRDDPVAEPVWRRRRRSQLLRPSLSVYWTARSDLNLLVLLVGLRGALSAASSVNGCCRDEPVALGCRRAGHRWLLSLLGLPALGVPGDRQESRRVYRGLALPASAGCRDRRRHLADSRAAACCWPISRAFRPLEALLAKHGYAIDARQELLGHRRRRISPRRSDTVTPLPVDLSQSAVNDKAGARSAIGARIFASVTLALCLLFLHGVTGQTCRRRYLAASRPHRWCIG